MLRSTKLWRATYAVWFIVLCILSSMSHPGPHVDVVGFDKVEHFTYFLLGGLALGLALSVDGEMRPWLGWIILLAGSGVGWFDEWHQSLTPGRSGLDLYDWVADSLGSAAAALALARVRLRILRGGKNV